jgi:hypothetical protein
MTRGWEERVYGVREETRRRRWCRLGDRDVEILRFRTGIRESSRADEAHPAFLAIFRGKWGMFDFLFAVGLGRGRGWRKVFFLIKVCFECRRGVGMRSWMFPPCESRPNDEEPLIIIAEVGLTANAPTSSVGLHLQARRRRD